jgi:hypothetical protein
MCSETPKPEQFSRANITYFQQSLAKLYWIVLADLEQHLLSQLKWEGNGLE